MLFLLLLAGFTLIAGKAQDHEIVYPRMIVSRSGEKRVLFRAFDQDFHLRLEPTDILSDDFVLITRDDNGVVYVKPEVERLKQSILQDPSIGATIAVDDSGLLKIKGIINEELHIEPDLTISSTFKWSGRRGGKRDVHGHRGGHRKYGRMFGDFSQFIDQGRQESMREVPHRVTKITPRSYDSGVFDEVIPPGVKEEPSNLTTEARQNKKITLEIIVVSDRIHSSRFRTDQDCITYHAVLMNCACLRYKTMPNIQVECKLVKVKRNKVAADEPYITNNMWDGHALSEPLLSSFAKYCAKDRDLSTGDIVKLITAQPMGDKEPGSNKANPGVIGIAYVGGVCDLEYKYGVSEDSGINFDGASTIAHEVAHLLGCPHDGDPAVSYLPGNPGTENCAWDLGFIMSYVRKDEKQFAFSSCSEKCVEHMSTLRSASCMFRQDVAKPLNIYDHRLPGEFLSDTKGTYDMKSIYGMRCKEKRSDLLVLKYPQKTCDYSCKTEPKDGYYYYWVLSCLDGDPCDTDMICRNGICTYY